MNTFYYVYVLRSDKDGEYYTGFAKDLHNRIIQHTEGNVESTKERRPLTLVSYEACRSEKDAYKREIYLKSFYGRAYLRKRIKNFLNSK